MTRYRGGAKVRSGLYWHPGEWEVIPLGKNGGVLPGTQEIRYIKIPVVPLLLLGSALGGVHMIFPPFIGLALQFGVAGTRVIALGKAAVAARVAEGRH